MPKPIQFQLPFRRQQRAIRARKRREKEEAAAIVDSKQCPRCDKWREDREYARYLHAGRTYQHRLCNHCRTIRYKQSGSCRRKRAYLMQLRSAPCADCNHQFIPEAMRFVCVEGRPRFNLITAWSGRRLEAIQEEAKRYVVVCANCAATRRKHEKERKKPTVSKLAELPPDLLELAGLADSQQDTTSEIQSQVDAQ